MDTALLDWSRAQFAMTAMYHWLFVPLTLGLGVIMAIMETMYVRTGNEQWKKTAKFWMNIFGINFAIGVATGLILEFQFGTNWSNYSWFVGDIFGAPLAIEAIVAFFMEATFISIMFFGWDRLSKRKHLAATWLTIIGATLSALWILVANAWMQYPIGMEFNPDVARNEMRDFWAIALSPMAIQKFLHSVISSWILGSMFVLGVSSWYLLKKRNVAFARQSINVAVVFGLIATVITLFTGHASAVLVSDKQPMKLAVMEGLYEGREGAELVTFAWPNPDKRYNNSEPAFSFQFPAIPKGLSILAQVNPDAYVPGIKDIIEGGYKLPDGETALSFTEKQARGKDAIQALSEYRQAMKEGNEAEAEIQKELLQKNYSYFGYGYLDHPDQLIPNLPLVFWSFHIMVYLGCFFILLFAVVWLFQHKKKLEQTRWLLYVCIWSIPLAYIAGQAGWVLAEVGRQPWAIQDVLPVQAALSDLTVNSVKTTFFVFLVLFSGLLVAEVRIMLGQIRKGPAEGDAPESLNKE